MDTSRISRSRRYGAAAAIGSVGVITGALLFGANAANAADTTTPSTTATAGTTASTPAGKPGIGGPSPVRSDEQAVTAEQAASLTAAAEKAVPGGTVVRIETDAGDGAYEAHMTKADGTAVTVTFDEDLAVIEVQDGMGRGDPQSGAPAGGPPAQGGTAPSGAPSAVPSTTA